MCVRLLLIQMTFSGLFNLLLWAGSALCFLAYGIDPHKDQANLYLGGQRHARHYCERFALQCP